MGLAAHPEGGWYRETWRGAACAAGQGDAGAPGRAVGTAIIFLLKADEASHWHRVDATELWLWQAGDPVELRLAASDAGPVRSVVLGADVGAGQRLQGLVAPYEWQAARPHGTPVHGYSLVSCVVVPGFDFAGFTLAPPGWEPGQEPIR
ncbi:MAG: cupin domain-containing protein [Erythrobacter tepidarius]